MEHQHIHEKEALLKGSIAILRENSTGIIQYAEISEVELDEQEKTCRDFFNWRVVLSNEAKEESIRIPLFLG